MRRIPTMMSSAGAAALTTLAVAVAVPAIGNEGSPPKTADALAACLRGQGLDDAPDGAALKPWLGRRLDGDATTERALTACAPQPAAEGRAAPSEQQLRSCLKDHGLEVPGDDPAALKRWMGEHSDEEAVLAARKACDIGMVTKSATAECGKHGSVTEAVPAKPGDKADSVKAPDGNGAAPGT